MQCIRIIIALILLIASVAKAQDGEGVQLQNAYAAAGQMLAVMGFGQDGRANTYVLNGVDYLTRDKNDFVKIAIQDLVLDGRVLCKPFQNGKAQCLNNRGQDIALALITSGLAIVNYADVTGTDFKAIYTQAENRARTSNAGLWSYITRIDAQQDTASAGVMSEDFIGSYIVYILGAIFLGPFLGMIIIGLILVGGLRHLISLQKFQITAAQKRDRNLREREKFIVAASLEGELNSNRAKLEAFIIIYEEMLKNLRDPDKEPKYKQGGDIIHKSPSLSRNVFDSNMEKMDLLGAQLVADLTALYVQVNPNPEYRTFEPDADRDEVIGFVADIIKQAEALLEPIDKIMGALQTIIRDKKTKLPTIR